MRNVNISNFRKNLFAYVSQTIDFNETINVNTKNGNIIVMSEDEYNGLIETLYLISNPSMKERIEFGMTANGEDLIEIDWRNEIK